MSNLALRILTAILGVPLILGLLYVGGWPFMILLLAAALGAQYELYGLMRLAGVQPHRTLGMAVGGLLALHAALDWALPLAVALVLLLLAIDPLRHENVQPLTGMAATLFGAVYPAAFLGFIGDLRLREGGLVGNTEAFYITLTVFLLVWATDTFAYFAGRSFGKHPLAPRVSPKKTWEGAIGGALGAVIVAVVLKLTLLEYVFSWGDTLAVALICGIISQFGDLVESKFKRSVGAKDSGTILPGHGGLLDRLDALILAAPLVYLYLAYVARIY